MSTEAIAASKDKDVEVREGMRKEMQSMVRERHPLKPEVLQETVVGYGEGMNPWLHEGPPVAREEIEISKTWLAFQDQRAETRETLCCPLWRNSVTVANEHTPPP